MFQSAANVCVMCIGVAIEISLAKDRSLSVVITGKEEAVKVARKLVLQQLQTQVFGTNKLTLACCSTASL